MASLLNEIVITDGNKQAFEAILTASQEHEQPVKLFVWGPVGSGKSTVLRARGRERDLLSSRRIISCHVGEVLASLMSGVNDSFLDEIGEVDVLMLDGVDTLVEQGELGGELCRRLFAKRGAAGLDTIVTSDVELNQIELPAIQEALSDFEIIEVKPLTTDELLLFAEKIQDSALGRDSDAPRLSDEVLKFITTEFAQSPDDVRNAVKYLATQLADEERAELTREKAAELLGWTQ